MCTGVGEWRAAHLGRMQRKWRGNCGSIDHRSIDRTTRVENPIFLLLPMGLRLPIKRWLLHVCVCVCGTASGAIDKFTLHILPHIIINVCSFHSSFSNKLEKRREKQINIKFIRGTGDAALRCAAAAADNKQHNTLFTITKTVALRLTVYARIIFLKIKFYEKNKIKFWEIFPLLLLRLSRFDIIIFLFFCFRSFAFFHLYFIFMVRFLAAFRHTHIHTYTRTDGRIDTTSLAACAHHDFLNDYV